MKQPIMKALFFLLLCTPFLMHAACSRLPLSLHPYGQVRLSTHLDTRAVFGERNKDFLFYPKRPEYDACGNDIHAHPSFQMTPAETRIGVIAQPHEPWRSWKIKGVIEADFFGRSELVSLRDGLANMLRLRHAYAQLDNTCSTILFGQYWHPMYVDECHPEVVSFNTGAPFDCQNRSPQIRISTRYEHIELMGALITQRDNVSDGPDGGSSHYLSNAVIPDLFLQISCRPFKNAFIGIAADVKRIVPSFVSPANTTIDASVVGVSTQLFAHYLQERYGLRAKIIYTQNASDLIMLGGYGIGSQSSNSVQSYTPLPYITAWLDLLYRLENHPIELGVFVAGSKSLGSLKNLFIDPATASPILFGLGTDVDYAVRLSGRCKWHCPPFRIGTEIEWTRAAFGNRSCNGNIPCASPVNNVRFLLLLWYEF